MATLSMADSLGNRLFPFLMYTNKESSNDNGHETSRLNLLQRRLGVEAGFLGSGVAAHFFQGGNRRRRFGADFTKRHGGEQARRAFAFLHQLDQNGHGEFALGGHGAGGSELDAAVAVLQTHR